MLDQLLIGFFSLCLAGLGAAEDLADGEIIGLKRRRAVGKGHFDDLDILCLQLIHHIIRNRVIGKNDLRAGSDNAVDVR